MKSAMFLIASAAVLGLAFILAYQSQSSLLWPVFAFLVLVTLSIGLLLFTDVGEATIDALGVKATFKRSAKGRSLDVPISADSERSVVNSSVRLTINGVDEFSVDSSRIQLNDDLTYHDYLRFIDELEPDDSVLYQEAAAVLQARKVDGAIKPDIAQAIGAAVFAWVARGHSQLSYGYPGTVKGERKQAVIRKLYRRAFKELASGRVVRSGDDNQKRFLEAVSNAVDRWAEREYLARAEGRSAA